MDTLLGSELARWVVRGGNRTVVVDDPEGLAGVHVRLAALPPVGHFEHVQSLFLYNVRIEGAGDGVTATPPDVGAGTF